MLTPTATPTATRWADRLTAAGLGVVAAGLLLSLVQYWGWALAAVDRYLILAAAGWAGVRQWPTVPAGTPRPGLGFLLVLLPALPLPLVWFLQTDMTGGRAVLIWWQWATLLAVGCGCVLLRYGWPAVRHLAFPPLFAAFALPLPTAVESPLKFKLQDLTTTASAAILRACGFAVERPGGGYLLRLPGGDLGVEETCSGVRSLTALTALAAFIAYRSGFRPVRGGALVLLSIPVVWFVNTLRVVLSGFIQEWAGDQYIRGDWHEGLGVVMVLVGLGAICLLAARLKVPAQVVDMPPAPVPVPRASRLVPASAVALTLAVLAAGAAAWVGGSARPTATPTPALAELPLALGDWTGTDRPVPPHVTEQLEYTACAFREYRDRLGRRVFVWVLYWSAAQQVKGYHHPDVCLPNAGLQMTSRSVEPLVPVSGGSVPVTCRVLSGDHGKLFVQYWTQEGRQVWGEAEERAASRGLGVRGVIDRIDRLFHGVSGPPPEGRLVILIGTEDASDWGRAEATAFAKRLADAVYTLCPWASPPVPPAQ
jgi:EpsI family protein